MKETKKQIKAQLTNDISLRFKKRIDALETELRCVRSELRECDNQRRKAERTVLELQDKVEKYDYWTRLEHQYAGMAMQGFLASANQSHALVEKLKSNN